MLPLSECRCVADVSMSRSPVNAEKTRRERVLAETRRTHKPLLGWKVDRLVIKPKGGGDRSEIEDGQSGMKTGSRRLAARMVTN